MSQDNEVSIKATATADIQDLVAWTQAMKDATAALSDYTDVAAKASAIGGVGAPGSAAGGSIGPDQLPSGPTAPTPPSTRPAAPAGATSAGAGGGGGGGGADTPTGGDGDGGGDSTPPPPTAAQNFATGYKRSRRSSVMQAAVDGGVQGGFWGAIGGSVAASMANDAQGGIGERSGRFTGRIGGMLGGPLGSWIGGKVGGLVGKGADVAVGFAGQVASQGTQLALGSSLTGPPMASAQKYMALSRTIAQMNARFREVEGSVSSFGGVLSYTVERSAAMAAALGEATDSFTKGTFRGYAGFARFRGLDGGAVMQSFGQMQAVNRGTGLSTGQMAQVDLASSAMGMNQGQKGQALQLIANLAQSRLEQTGSGDVGMAAKLASMPRDIFQPGWRNENDVDPRGRGSMAMGFLGQMDRMMTSRSGAGASTMMRAMGYGKKGGPTYREMRRRQDEGISNPQNLIDLQARISGLAEGISPDRKEDYVYKYIEALGRSTGADFKANQVDALTNLFSDEDRFAEFKDRYTTSGDSDAMEFAMKGMTKAERESFKRDGYFAAGQGSAGIGESIEVRIERMMLKIGEPLAKLIPDLQTMFENIVDGVSSLSTVDWAKTMTNIVLLLEGKSLDFKNWAEGADKVRQFQTDPVGVMIDAAGTTGRIGQRVYDNFTPNPDMGPVKLNLQGNPLYDGNNSAGGGR